MRFDDSQFTSDKYLHEYISKHAQQIIAVKRASVKHADAQGGIVQDAALDEARKANSPVESPADVLQVKVVINTTNLYDSHGDVHIPGLWAKSLREYKYIQHLQEHSDKLADVIADGDNLKAYTVDTTFAALGFAYQGGTQALVFDSKVDINRNAFMHKQYANGWVKQHSVRMQYVKMFACVDNKDYKEEFANYCKYADLVANREDIRRGYFFAVTEAKALEGSAVTKGSNHATPTLDNNAEPLKHSAGEPPNGTQKSKFLIY